MEAEDERGDAQLLSLDQSRTRGRLRPWDRERSFEHGSEAYPELLRALAAISRGAFEPVGIRQVWEDPYDPIELSFQLNGEERQIRLEYRHGYLDPSIFRQINRMIWPTGLSLEVWTPATRLGLDPLQHGARRMVA